MSVAMVLWGLAPVATRYLVLSADPLGVIAIRLAFASVCFAPLLPWIRPIPLSRRMIACGLVGIVGYNIPMTYGIQHVQAGLAGVLLATEPLWIALLGVVFLRERLTRPLLLGFVVAFLGVVTLSVGGGVAFDSSMLLGASLVLLGAFMWGVYSVAVGPLVHRYGALRVSAVTLWIGTFPLLLFSVRAVFTQHLSTTAWIVLFLYGLGPHLIGMLLWNHGVAVVGSTRAGLLLNLYPVVSVVGGVALLGEHVTAWTLTGSAIVLLGLVISQLGDVMARTRDG
nr:DMT family transporter [Lentzea sp. NBRC 105346]